MQAEINLMQEALRQPLNERFVLLSETCIPLYPATLVWAQLVSEPKSRAHACAKLGDSDDEGRRMTFRWELKVTILNIPFDYPRMVDERVGLTAGQGNMQFKSQNPSTSA